MTSNQSCSCCGQIFFRIYERSWNRISHEQACKRMVDFDSYIQKEFGNISKTFYCLECLSLFKKHISYLEAKHYLEERRRNASKEASECTEENNSLEAEESSSGNTVVQDDKDVDLVIDSNSKGSGELEQNESVKVENDCEANQENDQISRNLDASTTNLSVKSENELFGGHEMEISIEAPDFVTKCQVCERNFTELWGYLEHRLLCVAEKDMDIALEVKIEPDDVIEEHSYSVPQGSETCVQSKEANTYRDRQRERIKDTAQAKKTKVLTKSELEKQREYWRNKLKESRENQNTHMVKNIESDKSTNGSKLE